MRKKTKRGGSSILEKIGFKDINKKGIYIADDIDYNIRQGKKADLIKKYEDNLNEAKEEVKIAKGEKERDIKDENIQNGRDKSTIEQRKLRNNQFQFIFKSITNLGVFIINLFFKILNFLEKLLGKLIILGKSLGTGFKNICNVGNGVIIKTLILIFIIICIFFGVNAFINKEDPTTKVNDMITRAKDYSSFLINTKKPDIFGRFKNFLPNFIPDNYRFQFNFFKNKFNSIIGNDIYDIVGTPRTEIKYGRNDGIYHIKKSNDKYNTYTTLKPNDIVFPLSSLTSITDNDLNKLPIQIKELYPIENNLIIPVVNENNNWVYKIENIRDEHENISLKDKKPNYNLPFVKTNIINEFKFNKIKAKHFNNDDKSASTTLTKMFNFDNNKYMYPFK